MDPNKTPETDLSGFQEQGGYAPEEGDIPLRDVEKETPVEGTLTERKKLLPTYKGNRKFQKVTRKKKKLESDADIQTKGNMKGQPKPEDIFGEDYEGGPTYLRSSIKNILKYGLPVKSTYSGLSQIGVGGLKYLLYNQLR